MQRHRRSTSSAVCARTVLVAGLVAMVAFAAWASVHRSWTSSETVQVVPSVGGDPDRVIADQLVVLTSRSLHDAVQAAVGGTAPVSVSASQVRLSDVVSITGTATSPARAQATARVAAQEFADRVAASAPVQARLQVVDPASPPEAASSLARGTALVGLGGAAMGLAVALAFYALRPRVRSSYAKPPADVALWELEFDRIAPRHVPVDVATDLRRLVGQLSARGARGRAGEACIEVHALPGAGRGEAEWVHATLERAGASPVDGLADLDRLATEAPTVVRGSAAVVPGAVDHQQVVSVVLARAGVDSEALLLKEIGTRRAFAEVLAVILGARTRALVLPDPGYLRPRREATRGERRTWREGADVAWR